MNIKLSSRAALRIALIFVAALVAWLLVQTGHVAARGGPKPQPTELKAYLRGADTGDKIYSDNPTVPYISNRDTAGYPNNVILQPTGTLYLRIQKNRRVYFTFDDVSANPPSTSTYTVGNTEVMCHEYSLDGISGGHFMLNAPAFLGNGGTVTLANDVTYITTGASVKFVPGSGNVSAKWIEDANLPTIAGMEVNKDPLYVWLSVRFDTIDENESFDVYHNYAMWTGLSPRTGIAMVTHPSADTWVLVPLPPDDLAHPLRALGWNDASLSMTVGRDVKAGHSGGYCDLGYWNMPFTLTLKKR